MPLFFSRFSSEEKRLYAGAVILRILLFFFLLAYLGVAKFLEIKGGTSPLYLKFADNMLSGHGFGISGILESKKTPGYPLYLALFQLLRLPFWGAVLVQIGLFSLMGVYAMRMVRLLGFGKGAQRAAGILTAFEPLQLFYSVTLMPDSLTALFFFLGIYYLMRFWYEESRQDLWFAAVLFALANYFRPITIAFSFLLPVLIFVMVGLVKKKWAVGFKQGLFFGVVFFALVAPWMARNYIQFRSFVFSSGGAAYVLYFSGSAVFAAEQHIPFYQAYDKLYAQIQPQLPDPADQFSIRNTAFLQKKAVEIISSHLHTYLKLYLFALQTFFISGNYHFLLYDLGFIRGPSQGQISYTGLFAGQGIGAVLGRLPGFISEPYGMIALLGRVLLGAIFLASLVGAWRVFRKSKYGSFPALLYVLCLVYGALTVATAVEGIEARHRLFLNPLIFVFAAAGFWAFQSAQEKKASVFTSGAQKQAKIMPELMEDL